MSQTATIGQNTLMYPFVDSNKVYFVCNELKAVIEIIDAGQQRKAIAAIKVGNAVILSSRGKTQKEIIAKYIDKDDIQFYNLVDYNTWVNNIVLDTDLVANYQSKYNLGIVNLNDYPDIDLLPAIKLAIENVHNPSQKVMHANAAAKVKAQNKRQKRSANNSNNSTSNSSSFSNPTGPAGSNVDPPTPPAPKADPPKVLDVDSIDVSKDKMSDILNTFSAIKPDSLFISDLKWKFLARSVMRGKVIMLTGQSGTGKTRAIKAIADAAGSTRPHFVIPCGNTTDAKSILLGNTKYDPAKGTYLSKSLFVQALETPNAIIEFDEFTRLHPDGQNILLPVLDSGRRELVLDEEEGCPTIKVAEGVCFMASANIGRDYSATRVVDRALLDRFNVMFEMKPLTIAEEQELIMLVHGKPAIAKRGIINDMLKVVEDIRKEYNKEDSELSTFISTRPVLEMASLLIDEFSLAECIEVCVYPLYSDDGGSESERSMVKKIVQKFKI